MIVVAIAINRKLFPILRQKYSVSSSSQYSDVRCASTEMSVNTTIITPIIISFISFIV